MHVQLLDYYNIIISIYNENKKNTSKFSTLFEIPKAPNTDRKVIVINNNTIETHSKKYDILEHIFT